MAIESLIEKLIAALEANTAAQGGAKTSAKTTKPEEGDDGKKTTTAKGKGKAAPKHDAEAVKAVAIKLMDAIDRPTAKKLIKKHGADALADLKPEVYDDFVAEAEELIKEAEGGDGGDGDGL